MSISRGPIRSATGSQSIRSARRSVPNWRARRPWTPITSFPCPIRACRRRSATPERAKLLAARMTVEEMAAYIHADSLAFVSVDGLYRALGEQGRIAGRPSHCDACFTGDYPTSLTDHDDEGNVLPFPKEAVSA